MSRKLLLFCGCLVLLLSIGHSQDVNATESTDPPPIAAAVTAVAPVTAGTPPAAEEIVECGGDRGDAIPCPSTTQGPVDDFFITTMSSVNATEGLVELITDSEAATTERPGPKLTTAVLQVITENATEEPIVATEPPITAVTDDSIPDYIDEDNKTTVEPPAETTEVTEVTTIVGDEEGVNVTEAAPTENITDAVGMVTNATDVEVTTQPVEPSTETGPQEPDVPTAPGDPCVDYDSTNATHFTVKKPESTTACFDYVTSPSGWTRFFLDVDEKESAEIPTVAIKQDVCGVHFPFHLHLREDTQPGANETSQAQVCAPLKGEVPDHCAHRTNIEIHNCNNEFYVYKFVQKLGNKELCELSAGICLKKPGEEIPYEYLSNPPPTTAEPTTVTEPAVNNYGLPILDRELTEEEANGTLTVEYKYPEGEDPNNATGFWVSRDEAFRQMIADALNKFRSKPKVVITTQKITTVVADTTVAVTVVETEPGTTGTTTTTTTLAPTEPADMFERITVDAEDPIDDNPGVTYRAPDGPVIPDINDNDAAPGPVKRSTNVEEDNDLTSNKDQGPYVDHRADNSQEVYVEHYSAKEEEKYMYTKDDIFYVYGTPSVSKGILQISFVVFDNQDSGSDSNRSRRAAPEEPPSGGVVSQADLDSALKDLDAKSHEEETGLEYVQHYQGAPVEPDDGESAAVGAGGDPPKSIWEAHMGLFIAVIVLILICLIVVLIGILCIKCKGRKSKPEKTPLRAEEGHVPTTVIENPISDEEITRGEVPMTEAPNPAYTPNGSGQHLTKADEDNGWVVPLEELSQAERDRPEVENTKL